ncbi:MAG: DNA alkylation repair protein [Candidatus Aminicenantes bacterium]|nr:MAG: DNA alkylation repair protein [Candidatus Aminicenantes bacterium]
MKDKIDQNNVEELAGSIVNELRTLTIQNTPNIRAIRRKYSRKLKHADPKLILNLARKIFENYGYRWVAFELIRNHKAAFQCIGEAELQEFSEGLNSWGSVDAFAGILAGPAWLHGQVPDDLIHKWAYSEDRWWRRTALVCTVVLNRRSLGGTGDVFRTFDVCRILVDDKDDMVVKAMSWALRELIPHDADAVRDFLNKYDNVLAARVKREVNNKLKTGLKNPKRKGD